MRYGRDAIFVLNGGGHGYRPRATLDVFAFEKPVTLIHKHRLTVVRGDIDVLRIELAELVHYPPDLVNAITLHRREYLKGEKCALWILYIINDSHGVVKIKLTKLLKFSV